MIALAASIMGMPTKANVSPSASFNTRFYVVDTNASPAVRQRYIDFALST